MRVDHRRMLDRRMRGQRRQTDRVCIDTDLGEPIEVLHVDQWRVAQHPFFNDKQEWGTQPARIRDRRRLVNVTWPEHGVLSPRFQFLSQRLRKLSHQAVRFVLDNPVPQRGELPEDPDL